VSQSHEGRSSTGELSREREAVSVACDIAAGETLADMASYSLEALPEERRDIVWTLGGLVYDLERSVIVGLLLPPDVLPVLALGLAHRWEPREGGL
jgi:hypothetical protein